MIDMRRVEKRNQQVHIEQGDHAASDSFTLQLERLGGIKLLGGMVNSKGERAHDETKDMHKNCFLLQPRIKTSPLIQECPRSLETPSHSPRPALA